MNVQVRPPLESFDNDADTPIPEDIGQPFAYRCFIMPIRPRTVTKGGVILPDAARDADEYLNYVGKLAALGNGAFKHRKFGELGLTADDFPVVGDFVIYAPHSPMKITHRGIRFVVVNDDQILSVIPDPEGWTAYV